MTSPTHIFFAEFCLALASIGQGIEFNTANALASALGSLAPDIDNSNSWLGRLFPFISKPIEKKFGHRTLFHSIWIILTLVIFNIVLFLIPPLYPHREGLGVSIAFSIGYISHIIIDCTSIQGVKILYPLSMKNAVFPFDTTQPEAYRIKVGSKADIILGFIFLGLTLPLAFISYKTHTKLIREIQKDINSAVRSYNELAKNFICFAQLEGVNTTTHEHIKGEFLIVSAEKQNMLLVRTPDALTASVGKDNFKNDIFTTNIITIPKIKAKTEIKTLTIENQSITTAVTANPDSLVYLSGKIEFYEPIEIKKTLTKYQFIKQTSETKIELNFTPLDYLKKINIADKIIKRASLTVKTFYPLEAPLFAKAERESGGESIQMVTQTIEFNPTEKIILLIKQGQTVQAGQVIAFKLSPQAEKISLDIEKLKIKISKLQNEIVNLQKKITEDTTTINNEISNLKIEINQTQDLVKKNLKPQQALDELQKEINKLTAKKKILTLDYLSREGKIKTQIEELKLSIKQKEIELEHEKLKRTISATASGLVADIKQIQLKNKNSIIITLK